MYVVTKQHVTAAKELAVVLLDQSNAYGQLDRVGMTRLVATERTFCKTWNEALYQYATLQVFVLTPYGLSKGYKIDEGVIQGGGMDPIYFIWYTMLLAQWGHRHTTGVQLRTTKGDETLRPQAVVDDVTIFARTAHHIIREAEGLIQHGSRMNLVINADKFALLHYKPSATGVRCVPGRHSVGGYDITAQRKGEYVRLLGGNANWYGNGREELALMRRLSWRVEARAKLHTPNIRVLRVLVDGIVVNAWVRRHVVQLPADALQWHPMPTGVTAVVSTLARLLREVLSLPKKTAWRFIFGADYLAMTHPVTSLWVRFLSELSAAANSGHGQTRRAVQWEMSQRVSNTSGRPGDPEAQPDNDTDFDKLGRWCTKTGWWMRVVPDTSHGNRWSYTGKPLPTGQPLILAGDVSADAA